MGSCSGEEIIACQKLSSKLIADMTIEEETDFFIHSFNYDSVPSVIIQMLDILYGR